MLEISVKLFAVKPLFYISRIFVGKPIASIIDKSNENDINRDNLEQLMKYSKKKENILKLSHLRIICNFNESKGTTIKD